MGTLRDRRRRRRRARASDPGQDLHRVGPFNDWALRVFSTDLSEYNAMFAGNWDRWDHSQAHVFLVPRMVTDATMVGDEPVAAGFGRRRVVPGGAEHMSMLVSDRAGTTGGRTIAHELGH